MQRKPGQTRGPNALEKRFMAWVKEQPCCICEAPGPSIVDHMYGSTFRHNKVLIGMIALLPYCKRHDDVKTNGSHRKHLEVFGRTQAELWSFMYMRSQMETDDLRMIPLNVILAINDWAR